MPTVKGMIIEYLRTNGYDGLRSDECGCQLGDLMPCDEYFSQDCEAGYKVDGCTCGQGCDFHIVIKRPMQRCEGCTEQERDDHE